MELVSMDINQLLIEFKPLIHKTLQRLNIHYSHMDYDDFFQELQMKLVDLYTHFDGAPLEIDVDRYRFTSYAKTGLYWHGLNLLRNDSFNHYQSIENEAFDYLETKENLSEPNIFIEDFYQQVKNRLNDQDYRLFVQIAEGKLTIVELAEFMQISRDTIYQRKAYILKRIHDLKQCLTN